MNELNLQLCNVSKKYDSFALKNISLELPKGAILGLIGANGAGKTTTIRAILGLTQLDGGTITVLGCPVQDLTPGHREKIGVVFDECSFHENRTAAQMGKILGGMYQSWDAPLFDRLLERLELPNSRTIKEFSRGMKMKLSIAAALAHHPTLLLLDEPTGGLDPIVRTQMLDLFLEFIQDEQCSILLSSHITTDLARIADYVAFLDHGQVVLAGDKDDILEHYGILKGSLTQAEKVDTCHVIGMQKGAHGFEALVSDRAAARSKYPDMVVDTPTLDDILLHITKGEKA